MSDMEIKIKINADDEGEGVNIEEFVPGYKELTENITNILRDNAKNNPDFCFDLYIPMLFSQFMHKSLMLLAEGDKFKGNSKNETADHAKKFLNDLFDGIVQNFEKSYLGKEVDTTLKDVPLKLKMDLPGLPEGFFQMNMSYEQHKLVRVAGSLDEAFEALPKTLENLKAIKEKNDKTDDKLNFDEKHVRIEINFVKSGE